MGMNQDTSNNFQKGFKLFEDMFSMVAGQEESTPVDYSGDYREKARMMELDAMREAQTHQRTAQMNTREMHAKQEHERAKANTRWGQSGVTMDGSSELVREARRHDDRQDEQDLLLEGEMKVKDTLDKGRHEANLYRISKGQAPNRSTLSLGSTIYKYGR